MLKKIAIVAMAALLLLAGYISSRPDAFVVTRAAIVPGTPDIAYGLVKDFHLWSQWSPWEKIDPNMKRTYGGRVESGVDATYAWAGNSEAGEGRMLITTTLTNEMVTIKLDFTRPFVATNIVHFTFEPAKSGTRVVWSMTGRRNFMSKAFGLFMDMDQRVGKDFEKGLANMAVAAQAEVTKRAEAEAVPSEGTPAVAVPTP
ncbi:SRPBCC family protein [Corallococcus sp. M7]